MPPRHWIALIILFWLGTTGWMITREILPYYNSGEPPAFQLDLEEEVSAKTTNWQIYEEVDGKKARIGMAVTSTKRVGDLYRLDVNFLFTNWQVLILKVRKCQCEYRITESGDLRGVNANIELGEAPFGISVEMRGTVEKSMLACSISANSPALDKKFVFDLDPVPLSENGNVVNTMHPMNRIRGLFEGRSWKIPTFEPLELAFSSWDKMKLPIPISSITGSMRPKPMIATVVADHLVVKGVDVACWRIDFAETNNPPKAHIWVRQSDGLVLQQESQVLSKKVTMKRMFDEP